MSRDTVCILTGQPGENADDCTTHEHEDAAYCGECGSTHPTHGTPWLLAVEGGIHPDLTGPYDDDGAMHAEGSRIYADQDSETDALFILTVGPHGELTVESWGA